MCVGGGGETTPQRETGTTVRERLEHLEWLAELYSRAITIGTPSILTDKDLENVIMAALSMNYGTTQKIHTGENSEASA